MQSLAESVHADWWNVYAFQLEKHRKKQKTFVHSKKTPNFERDTSGIYISAHPKQQKDERAVGLLICKGWHSLQTVEQCNFIKMMRLEDCSLEILLAHN